MTTSSPPTDAIPETRPLEFWEAFVRLAEHANSHFDDADRARFALLIVELAPHLTADIAWMSWTELCVSLRKEHVARDTGQGCQAVALRHIANRAARILAGDR